MGFDAIFLGVYGALVREIPARMPACSGFPTCSR